MYTRRAALLMASAAPAALSQTKETEEKRMAHPVVHFEIGCQDIGKTSGFYSELFGWGIQVSGPAGVIDSGTGGVSGHMTSLGHEPFRYTMFYVEVEDIQEYLDRAVKLGGKVVVPPVKIPTGTFAWFSDLEGNTVGLLKKR